MKPKSAKEKGSRLERYVAKRLRQKKIDPNAKRMPLSGAIPGMRADIRTDLPLFIECKCREKWGAGKFWEWWDSTKNKAPIAHMPAVVISANYRQPVVVLDLEDWLNYVKTEQDYLDEHAGDY